MPEHFDYFPLYVHQLMSSQTVRKMMAADFGGYMFLLIESFLYDPQGYLPEDEEELREFARMSTSEWAESSPIILKKFKKRQGGLIYNPRMMEVIKDLRAKREKASNAGRIGASKRWGQAELDFNGDGNAIASPSPKQSQRREEKRKKEKRREATQYTLDFDSFWKSYPHGTNRGSKVQTFRNWNGLLTEGILPRDLLTAADNYAEHLKAANQEPQYHYRASNFVGQARYFEAFMPGTWKPPEAKSPPWEDGMSKASDFENESPEEREKRDRETRAHNERVRARRRKERGG